MTERICEICYSPASNFCHREACGQSYCDQHFSGKVSMHIWKLPLCKLCHLKFDQVSASYGNSAKASNVFRNSFLSTASPGYRKDLHFNYM